MAISSGDRRHSVIIQVNKPISDKKGGFHDNWVNLYQVGAAIWPINAKEATKNETQTLSISHKVRIPFIPEFKAEWRILFGSRYLSIVSIRNPEEANIELELLCKEVLK